MLPQLGFYEVPGAQTQVVRPALGLPTDSSPGFLICISLITNPDGLFTDWVTCPSSLEECLFAPFACDLGCFLDQSYHGALRIK